MLRLTNQSLAFAGSAPALYNNITENQAKQQTQSKPAEVKVSEAVSKNKKTIKEHLHNFKLGVMNFYKGFNKIKEPAIGIIRGIGEGVVSAVAVGTVGANLSKSKKSVAETMKNVAESAANEAKESAKNVENYPLGKVLLKTLGGTITDVAKSVWGAVKYIPKMFNQNLKSTFKEMGQLPAKFIKYMNETTGAKKLTVLSSLAGIGFIAYRAVEGRIHANKKNANIDHALNEGHVPTN